MAPASRQETVKQGKNAPRRAGRAAAGRASGQQAASATGRGAAGGSRAERSAERRQAILAAALEEFSAHSFEATPLDDVARRANIAKGTIYLYFSDKETLFQELVRSMIGPLVGIIEALPATDLPLPVLAARIADMFVREVIGTRRKDVIRLMIAEGPRFPKLAEFYYREVLERVFAVLRGLITRAFERGEIEHEALARFPQLLVAPGLVAVVWSGLFDRFAPLDAGELMRAHLDILFGARRPT